MLVQRKNYHRQFISALCAIALWLGGNGTLSAADLPLRPFAYKEGFEGEPPEVALWASRGSPPVINYIGPSEETAQEGKRSLKIDIIFGDSPYYYFGVPLRVPLAGELRLSAYIKGGAANQARFGFGINALYPPSTHSGCGPIESFSGPADWQPVQADLVARGQQDAAAVIPQYLWGFTGQDTAPMLDRWAVFLYGNKGQRAVVFVDNIRIEGAVPDEAPYIQQAEAAFAAKKAQFRLKLAAWRQELQACQTTLQAAQAMATEAPALFARWQKQITQAEEILSSLDKQAFGAPADVEAFLRRLTMLQNIPQTLSLLRKAVAEKRQFIVFPCNQPTLLSRPTGTQADYAPSAEHALRLSACAGEYESVSAFVLAFQDVSALRVTMSALRSPSGTIPASAGELYIVKSWFQGATRNIGYTPRKWLIPELLLKDDALVRVDLSQEANFLRSTNPDGTHEYLNCSDTDSSHLQSVRPVDAPVLQPVDIPAGEWREFWLTLHVPAQAKPGRYEGLVRFASATGGNFALPIQLTVHPFILQPSRLIYSIYYRARLSEDGQPGIDSENRSEEQYRAEMADLRAHGVLYPTNYLALDEKRLTRQLQIRREVGLPAGRFYNLGYIVGPQKPEQIPELQQTVKRWLDFLRPWGYTDVYFYGIDEATGERLAAQKAAWAAAQEAGGKTFVACYRRTFETMGKLLNVAVLAGPPDPEEAKKWHSVGSQIFCYANPQVGVEDPLVYRRNFGLLLWKAGYDGAMDYAYQHGFNHIWNDFDHRSYRDHNFTYPTVNGIVGTIQWEGFREGVDDVRYVTTLEKAIANAPAAKKRLAAQAQKWLQELDPAKDNLDDIRAQIVRWIKQLM